MELSSLFFWGPLPNSALTGSYSTPLVALSYFMASFASYVALDITERIRTEDSFNTSKIWWLILGAFAMGSGIWTMHFIGMLAFIMPMPMYYNPYITGISLIVAVIASGLAFYLIKNKEINVLQLVIGGVFMGLGICCMHYTGMAAMTDVEIQYYFGLFTLSIIIAILASEAALWLMLKSSKKDTKFPKRLKVGSALIMGLAVCGMHYTGMAAAVFTHPESEAHIHSYLSPDTLSLYVAATTILILAIALTASKSWTSALQVKNQKLIETENILEQKSHELLKLNENLRELVATAMTREEHIRMILAAAADGIIVMNEVGDIEICNNASELILGYRSHEIMGKNITSFFVIPDNLKLEKFNPIFFPMFTENLHMTQQLYILNKEKMHIPIELTLSKSLVNNTTTYIIVFREITQRKASEEKLIAMHKELVSTARLAGMADVAISVLHNIGNVLNSVNTSVQILLEKDKELKLQGIIEISRLLQQHKNNLEKFLSEDRIGKILPQYLEQFSNYLENERLFFREELHSLNNKISHIKKIVIMHQSLSKCSSMAEPTDVNQVIEEALAINTEDIEKFGISIVRDYAPLPLLQIDKIKIAQILVNLIKNSVEILMISDKEDKKITLRTFKGPSHVQIEVIDNGKGIPLEGLTKIFSYGFTTKKDGHGIGLHASSLTAQEIGGSLKAYSDGDDQGAKFILSLPFEPNYAVSLD